MSRLWLPVAHDCRPGRRNPLLALFPWLLGPTAAPVHDEVKVRRLARLEFESPYRPGLRVPFFQLLEPQVEVPFPLARVGIPRPRVSECQKTRWVMPALASAPWHENRLHGQDGFPKPRPRCRRVAADFPSRPANLSTFACTSPVRLDPDRGDRLPHSVDSVRQEFQGGCRAATRRHKAYIGFVTDSVGPAPPLYNDYPFILHGNLHEH